MVSGARHLRTGGSRAGSHIARKKAGKLPCIPLPADAPRWEVTIALPAITTAAGETFLAPIRRRLAA